MKKIKVGVIGLGQRGMGLLGTMMACEEADVVAVCDKYKDRREDGAKRVKETRGNGVKQYEDYRELIDDKDVEAVVIATSWDEHTRMAVYSMKAGKYTAVEVAGAYDIEDCWQLVRTYEDTKTPIMMLENCCFDKFELHVAGAFGKTRGNRVLSWRVCARAARGSARRKRKQTLSPEKLRAEKLRKLPYARTGSDC